MRLSRRRAAIATCCLLALPSLAFAQAGTTAPADRERPTVRVSRDELRIVFPRDTAHRWGWSVEPAEPANAPRYSWRMEVDAIQGPRDLRLDVRSTIPFPSTFKSLGDLLGTGHGYICSYGMVTECGDTRMTGTAEHDHAVLTLRESALISWVFALRPRFVRLTNDRPETSFAWDSVRIEYVAPSVRPLDSASMANALRARRRESLAHFSVQRGIIGGRGLSDRVWLIVGDSLPLVLLESQRMEDMHLPGQRDLTDSVWIVLDPRIAQLVKPSPGVKSLPERRAAQDYVVVADYAPPRMYIKALRPGVTKIRVRGVHGLLDAALDSDLPPGVLERDVFVTLPPVRIEITPRPLTLRAGERLPTRVRVYDTAGEATDRIPVKLECMGCMSSSYYGGTGPDQIWSDTAGRMTIVARLDALADTLSVVVIDSVSASPKH